MTLTLHDIDFRTELPQIPSRMPVARTAAQCEHDRVAAFKALREVLDLGDAIDVDLPDGFAIASKRGEIQMFAASGGIRARDAEASSRFTDERRPWDDIAKRETRRGTEYTLGDQTAERLMGDARSILERAGLADAGVAGIDVTLAQWALLDEKGTELDSGPGQATVRLSYQIEGTPLIGAGAKTRLHYDPQDGEPRLARLFHVNRRVEEVRGVDIGGMEPAFADMLSDPWLAEQTKRGGRIAVIGLQVGLLAQPAMVPQRFAYPAVAVEGVVEGLRDPRSGEYELRFGRIYPAASAEALRRAGVAVPIAQPAAPRRPKNQNA